MEHGKKLNKMIKNETVLITGENGSLAKKIKHQLKLLGYNVVTYTSKKNLLKKTVIIGTLKKHST